MVEGNFTSLQKEAVWWPARLRQAAAVCNSLTFVRKNKVVGDPAEMKMCQAVEAHFVVGPLRFAIHVVLSSSDARNETPGQPGMILGFSLH